MPSNVSSVHPRIRFRWLLVLYDLILLMMVDVFLLILYPSTADPLTPTGVVTHLLLGAVCIFAARFATQVYRQIWRYATSESYLRLILADAVGGAVYIVCRWILPIEKTTFVRTLSVVAMNLLCALLARILYQYLYRFRQESKWSGLARRLITLSGATPERDWKPTATGKIGCAIVGAGHVGVTLAQEMQSNQNSLYCPACLIDDDKDIIGRNAGGVHVLSFREATPEALAQRGVQEIIFAKPSLTVEQRRRLYEKFKVAGLPIKVYDAPTVQDADHTKRLIRSFDVEELLFRRRVNALDESAVAAYQGKTILITGGGGSIGSELCRQVARMSPKALVILDIYENSAYDIQQELKQTWENAFPVYVEIVSVCDRDEMEKVMERYHPDVVLHAAAHKHVPLMEHNCCEAVRNNVFGTLTVALAAEKYAVPRFIMISTDKAVNPTNVMGATKRMCEMLVLSQNHAKANRGTCFTATRFGNVLGSNGSVIPLFKRQIAAGGPVTLTDKRITRYFMMIPEAAQLVLQSGAKARSGELFVLDMGQPVRILTLAENMIRLSGFEPYRDIDIIETGLRPGEKLYEELLIKGENLSKTDNDLIFIEKDAPLSEEELSRRLALLQSALNSADEEAMRRALHEAVPTFVEAEEFNRQKAISKEGEPA